MPVIEQIAILLALTSGAFDAVPLERMTDAQAAVAKVAKTLPREVQQRLVGDESLQEADRKALVDAARTVLASFATASS